MDSSNITLRNAHFGSISDSLGRLAAASECMASIINLSVVLTVHQSEVDFEGIRLICRNRLQYRGHQRALGVAGRDIR